MKVCHFCETSVGGNYFKNMARGLIQKGARVSMVELGPNNPPQWMSDQPEVRYFSLGATGFVKVPIAAWRLAAFLRREKVDILHTHLFFGGIVGVLAKPLAPKTVVVMMRHHTSVVRLLGTRFHVLLDKLVARFADKVVTVSEAAKNYMRDKDGIRREVFVVHSGFDFDQMRPSRTLRSTSRNEFGYSEEDFVIGYVGNFAPGKGHVELIKAFHLVLREIPEARLLLVGGGDLEPARLRSQELEVNQKVSFAGWRSDIPACLNSMDVFVQPSLSEAFSQVLVEAMGVGLPVVATKVGGAGEVIVDNDNGLLVEPNDANAIAQAVINIHNDLELRKKLTASVRASVVDRYSVARMVDKQFDLYKSWLVN